MIRILGVRSVNATSNRRCPEGANRGLIALRASNPRRIIGVPIIFAGEGQDDSIGANTAFIVLIVQQPLDRKLQIAQELIARVRLLPKVEAAGFTNSPPLENLSLNASLLPPGMTDREYLVSPGGSGRRSAP